MIEAHTLYYLAGLFDGEGTVTLTKRISSNQFRTPTLSLTSTTKELVDLCKEHFGGWIVHKKHTLLTTNKPGVGIATATLC